MDKILNTIYNAIDDKRVETQGYLIFRQLQQ